MYHCRIFSGLWFKLTRKSSFWQFWRNYFWCCNFKISLGEISFESILRTKKLKINFREGSGHGALLPRYNSWSGVTTKVVKVPGYYIDIQYQDKNILCFPCFAKMKEGPGMIHIHLRRCKFLILGHHPYRFSSKNFHGHCKILLLMLVEIFSWKLAHLSPRKIVNIFKKWLPLLRCMPIIISSLDPLRYQ